MSRTAVRLWSTLVATLVAIGGPAALGAQAPTLKPLARKATKSCGPFALILVTVVDSKGAPVTDARIEVWRQRDNEPVPGSMSDMSPGGQYTVIDDMSKPMVAASGENFVVRARRGKAMTTKVLRIGHTSDGCHVVVLSGSRQIVL